MNAWISNLICLSALLFLSSCGGGGGSSEPDAPSGESSSPLVQPRAISAYSGAYSGSCHEMPEATHINSSKPIYAVLHFTVSPESATEAAYAYRLDFFGDSFCQFEFLGTFTNANPRNRVHITGAVTTDLERPYGLWSVVNADKVQHVVGLSSNSVSPGSTADRVVIESSDQIEVPSAWLGGFEFKDLWFASKYMIIQGVDQLASDGYPVRVSSDYSVSMVSTSPQMPTAHCVAQTVVWNDGKAQCSAKTGFSISGEMLSTLRDDDGFVTGSAMFACTNGNWVQAHSGTCTDATPAQPVCPEQTFTWTVNGNTCTGTVPASYHPINSSADNVTPGLMGAKLLTCAGSPSSKTGYAWSEFIFAPTYPTTTAENCEVVATPEPTTDPRQILANSSCMACHSIGNETRSLLSFQTIAARYRDNPPAPGVLEKKIKSGGMGVFLDFPMPANPQISDAELAIVLPWILSR